MIKVREISKSFQEIRALNRVSLDVRQGRVLGILGPNGCGKTTLIKSILGLVVPDHGEIQVMNERVGNEGSYRKKLGYMPQNPEFPTNLMIDELFDMLEDVREAVAPLRKPLIHLFGLEKNLNRSFRVLSGGTRQKVAAVAAFMFDPDILVLDEPTVGLDPVSAAHFKKLVTEVIKRGKSVLLVTHILSEIEALADDLVFMLEGEVQYSGTLDELKSHTRTESIEEAVISLAKEKRTQS